eukprot:gene10985-3691_t
MAKSRGFSINTGFETVKVSFTPRKSKKSTNVKIIGTLVAILIVLTMVIFFFGTAPSTVALIISGIFSEVAKTYKSTNCVVATIARQEQFGNTIYYYYNVAYNGQGARLNPSNDALTTRYTLGTPLTCWYDSTNPDKVILNDPFKPPKDVSIIFGVFLAIAIVLTLIIWVVMGSVIIYQLVMYALAPK